MVGRFVNNGIEFLESEECMEFHVVVALILAVMFLMVIVGILVVCFKKLFFPSWQDLPPGEYAVVAKGKRWARLAGGCLSERGNCVKFGSTKSLTVGGIVRIYKRQNSKAFAVCPVI